jgi:hypothetical protein
MTRAEPRMLATGPRAWLAGLNTETGQRVAFGTQSGQPQIWLEDMRLVTRAQNCLVRAAPAKSDAVETFVYWMGDEQETVLGLVEDECKERSLVRFIVSPKEPGAHAI